MRKIIFVFFLFSQLTVFSQRLNFGFGMSFFSLYNSHIKEDVVFAKHSYKAYYVKKNQFSTVFSFQYSFITSVDYGRFILSADFSYYTQSDGLVTKLSYPIANNEFSNYYSRISTTCFNLSPIVSYVLTNRHTLKLFVETGLPYTILNKSLVTEKIVYGEKSSESYLSNQDEMKNEFGLNHDYFNFMLGIGYRISSGSISIRYINKINSKSDYGNNLGYFTFNLSAFTNFSKLKKHYIYID